MMDDVYSVKSDKQVKIKLDSQLIYALWKRGVARGTAEVPIEVRTAFVGEGAELEITVKADDYGTIDKFSDTIFNNRYQCNILIPEDIDEGDQVWFTVKIGKLGIKSESNQIAALAAPVLLNMTWNKANTCRKNEVTIKAQIDNVDDGTSVVVKVYEYAEHGIHSHVADIPATIKNRSLNCIWEFNYIDDVKHILTESEARSANRSYQAPRFFYIIDIDGAVLGEQQESGFLIFDNDSVDIVITDDTGMVFANAKYNAVFADGSEKSGTLDENGRLFLENVPPGRIDFSFSELQNPVSSDTVSNETSSTSDGSDSVNADHSSETNTLQPSQAPESDDSRKISYVEFEDKLFRTNSAVVLPDVEDPDSDSSLENRKTSAVGLAATCLRYLSEHPDKKILVAGHTDTAGNIDYNHKLSRWRAQNIMYILSGNAAGFSEICGSWERMKVSDYKQILTWIAQTRGWDCNPGAINDSHDNVTQTAVNNFRKAYNKQGPGSSWAPKVTPWGEANNRETWEAYFNCYEEYLAEQLGEDRSKLTLLRSNLRFVTDCGWAGCNEYHPRVAENIDDFPCDSNRRVEVIFFDPTDKIPVLECASSNTACGKDSCELYDQSKYPRVILQPTVSAKPWAAQWDNPSDTVIFNCKRSMKLEAPGLQAGEPVTFTLIQYVDGKATHAVPLPQCTSQLHGANCDFDQWFNRDRVSTRVTLDREEKFPKVCFAFTAEAGGRKVQSGQITYSDTIDVKYLNGLIPIASTDCTIHTQWGTLKEVSDSNGCITVNGLPPGGANITLDGYRCEQ